MARIVLPFGVWGARSSVRLVVNVPHHDRLHGMGAEDAWSEIRSSSIKPNSATHPPSLNGAYRSMLIAYIPE